MLFCSFFRFVPFAFRVDGWFGLYATTIGILDQVVYLGMGVALRVVDRRARATFGDRRFYAFKWGRGFDVRWLLTTTFWGTFNVGYRRVGVRACFEGILFIFDHDTNTGTGDVAGIDREGSQRGNIGIGGTGYVVNLNVGRGVVKFYIIVTCAGQWGTFFVAIRRGTMGFNAFFGRVGFVRGLYHATTFVLVGDGRGVLVAL